MISWLDSFFVPRQGASPLQSSVCGSANKEPATLLLHIHSVANRTWESRLTAILMGPGASSRHRARRVDHLGLNEFVQERLAGRQLQLRLSMLAFPWYPPARRLSTCMVLRAASLAS